MKRPKTMSVDEVKSVRIWLYNAKSVGVLRRILCVWLRIKGHDADQIAEMIGWSVGQVQKIQSEFLRKGERVFMVPGKGGRRHQYLTPSQEIAFINSLRDTKTGMIFLNISEIKRKFHLATRLPENAVAESTIYRLLGRHGYKSAQLQDGRRAFKN